MKEKKSGSGLMFFVIILIAIFLFISTYGFSLGGGDIKILSDESTVTIDGDDNAVVSIAGNRNTVNQWQQRKQAEEQGRETRGDGVIGGVFFIILILVLGSLGYAATAGKNSYY